MLENITITQNNNEYSIYYNNIELPALWLRERSQSKDSLDKNTNQRYFNTHLLDYNLSIKNATKNKNGINITFSDNHQETFPHQFFQQFVPYQKILPDTILWKNPITKIPEHNWQNLNNPKKMLNALTDYLQYGFIIITQCNSNTKNPVLTIGKKFGYIQEIFDGKCWDVISKPDYNDLAYKAGALAPHSDMPYSLPQPGAQLLLCIENQTTGGLSTLVDTLQAAETLKQINASFYQTLAETPVRFQYDSKTDSLALERPIIETDHQNNMTGVRYSPRLDFMPLMAKEKIIHYHKARQEFNSIVNSQSHQITFRLEQNQCMIFDNSRILHGRTEYNPNQGHRHLQGTYIRKDGPANLYRKINRDGKI